MSNRDLDAAWGYHNGTKHSFRSVRAGARGLDWANRPIPFKVYTSLTALPLPEDSPLPEMAALAAIAHTGNVGSAGGWPAGDTAGPPALPGAPIVGGEVERGPDLPMLAALLRLSAGITREIRYPGGTVQFRAAACTGALYHIDLYLVCGDLAGLEAGVYHFGPQDFALRRLRSGDHRDVLARASPSLARAPTILVFASTYWRNAWKYQARTYRHCFWDSGTILANLLACAAGFGLPARVVLGFADATVNHLLGLNAEREAALGLVALGRGEVVPAAGRLGGTAGSGALPDPEPLALETLPLSRREVDYPEIMAKHAASSLESDEEVAAWRGAAQVHTDVRPALAGPLFLLPVPGIGALPDDSIGRVILRRGSSRRFVRRPVALAQLAAMLDRATRGIPADFLSPQSPRLNDLYLIVNAVDGLAPGGYVYHRDGPGLELLREGDCRQQAGYLGLEQELPADASVNVFFLADLNAVLHRFGNRGYRAAQLEAAIMGGKLYLAAYALGLGATGLTFYDDDVTNFFSPRA
ncbi:MAG: SagB/ThcOx family dehydrogenase, partial [Chloroflexi bacterium]|nr:SagB/ThcOx family dehydrogenase [Chloroflexota bacterium]